MEDINSAIKENILKDFKVYNDIKNADDKENLFKLYVDKAVQTILNLTNRLSFPEPLRYIVLDLMNDFFDVAKSKNNETPATTVKDITSMSERGRTVSFGSQSATYYSTLISKHIDEQLDMRMKEIYRYRLLYREVLSTDGQD